LTQDHADMLTHLGDAYSFAHQHLEAVSAYEEAAAATDVADPNSPRVAVALNRLADAHSRAGQHDEALIIYRRLIDGMRRGPGAAHPGYRPTLERMASSAQKVKGKSTTAAKAYKELLSRYLEPAADGADGGGEAESAAAAADAHLQLGIALAGVGKPASLEEGLQHAKRAVAMYAGGEVPGAKGSLDHARALNGVAGICEKLDRDSEALARMEEAFEVVQQLGSQGRGWLGLGSADAAAEGRAKEAEKNLAGLHRRIERKQERQAGMAKARRIQKEAQRVMHPEL